MTAKEFSAVARDSWHLRGRALAPGAAGVYDEHDVAICPDVRAAGHNPRGLTVAQVGAGYRLLAEEEVIAGRRLHGGDRYAIEAWIGSGWDATGWAGNEAMYTYRTKQPPGFFLPAEAWRKAEEALGKKTTTDAEATPTPAGTKYVHTFVCHACSRTCTMETVSNDAHLGGSSGMRCPFTSLMAIWRKADVQTLTP